MKQEIFENWTKREWPGNPGLKLDARVKTFKNPFNNKKANVWVFGKDGNYLFCVDAGATSSFSYMGLLVENSETFDIDKYVKKVDELYKNKQLIR